jgi:Domain of unknown function (DUF4288)
VSWFTASLLFESSHSDPKNAPGIWEESLVLISALDLDAARDQAERIGVSREHAYVAQGDDTVTWKFRQIERVFQIESPALVTGTEVHSRFLKPSEAASLLTPFDEQQ